MTKRSRALERARGDDRSSPSSTERDEGRGIARASRAPRTDLQVPALMRWAEARARELPCTAAELAFDLFVDRLVTDYLRRRPCRRTILSYWYHCRLDALRRTGRAARHRLRDAPDLDLFSADAPPPEEDAGRSETAAFLASCLWRLSALERKAVELRYLSELPYSSVAGALAVPEGTARSLCWRGVKKLRQGFGSSSLEMGAPPRR